MNQFVAIGIGGLALFGVSVLSGCGANRVESTLTEMEDAEKRLREMPTDQSALNVFDKYVRDRNPLIRGNAIAFIGRLPLNPLPPRHASAVYTAVDDPDEFVQKIAVEALLRSSLDPTPIIPQLIRFLDQGDTSIAWASAEVLGRAGAKSSSAVPSLIKALDVRPSGEGGAQLRVYAADALGQIGEDAKAAIPRLEELQSDGDPEFEAAVKGALMRIRHAARSGAAAAESLTGEGTA